jgi:predicted NAD/FAD-binding protein
MKIAIIGSGIAGLSSSYYLIKNNRDIQVDLYEKNNKIGGHSLTYTLNNGEKVDIGFQVFNYKTYPNLMRLFQQLNIEVIKTCMSFSVIGPIFEWGAKNLFAVLYNLLSIKFWNILWNMWYFHSDALLFLDQFPNEREMTLKQFCDMHEYSDLFVNYYLIPFCSAVWSTSCTDIKEIAIIPILQFMKNHSLLSFKHEKWYTMKNRSEEYVSKLVDECGLNLKIYLNSELEPNCVAYENNKTYLSFKGESLMYDHIIFAINGSYILPYIKNPTQNQKDVLSLFETTTSDVYLHSDSSYMPSKKINWSSWNVVCVSPEEKGTFTPQKTDFPVCTYWLQSLQHITDNNVFLTLNPGNIDKCKVIDKFTMTHPQMSVQSIKAQSLIPQIQGVNNIWYCGAYLINGFHEDGIVSGLKIVEYILQKKMDILPIVKKCTHIPYFLIQI